MDPELDQQWLEFLHAVRPLRRNDIECDLSLQKKDLALVAACFQDVKTVLAGSHFAYLKFFQVREDIKDKGKAVFYELYYLDDLLIRLYPAGEKLADAIFYMLELKEEDLEPFKEGRASRQSIVGNYLQKQKPDHPITRIVKRLIDSPEWRTTMDYRGDWVHGQPPIIEGTGSVFKRESGWTEVAGERRLPIMVAGDPPKYTTDDILAFTRPALSLFIEVALGCMDVYVKMLEEYGITFNSVTGRTEGSHLWNLAHYFKDS